MPDTTFHASTVEAALDEFFRVFDHEGDPDYNGITFENWASFDIRIVGMDREIPSPFLEAYSRVQDGLYRLVALIEHGNADIRSLREFELERYQLRVTVTEGSSLFSDNLPDICERIAKQAFQNMSGRQVVIVVLGLALIGASTFGGHAYLEHRRELRLEEIRSEERREGLEAVRFSNEKTLELFGKVLEIMHEDSPVSSNAAEAALDANDGMLRAASKVDGVEVAGAGVSRELARELRSGTRRRASVQNITASMAVLDINTEDPFKTTIILKDPETGQIHKVTYKDSVIAEDSAEAVFSALRERSEVVFNLSIRTVEGEVVSTEILGVEGHENYQAPAVASSISKSRDQDMGRRSSSENNDLFSRQERGE